MIEMVHLVKRFGPTLAVDDLNVTIPKGQIVGFLGPNGAGKTTTIRMLTGFIPPTSGRASIDGFDALRQSRQVRQRIGYLPENTPLYPEMKVDEFLHFRGKLFGMRRADRKRRITELTGSCGLEKIVHRPIGALSRGNRQRVGLAQALLHEPPVLVLDEPTAGLDPTQIQEVRSLLAGLSGKHTIVLSSHILPEIEKTADRVVVISRGRLVADDMLDALRRKVVEHSAIVAEVHAGAAEVEKAIKPLDHVRSVHVSTMDGWTRARIAATNGRDVREAVARAITSRGWTLRELRFEQGTLEEFFVHITAEQDRAQSHRVIKA